MATVAKGKNQNQQQKKDDYEEECENESQDVCEDDEQEDEDVDDADANDEDLDENDDDADGNDEDADGDNDGDGENEEENDCSEGPKYIRLRGLPWSATHKEIIEFLKNVNVVGGAKGIHLVTSRWDGKSTGEAYVELKSFKDAEEARKLNKAKMQHRYIEVFNATSKEVKEVFQKNNAHGDAFVVKLRGLPYSVTEEEIEKFFNGLEIKPDREGILIVMDRRGRATGEAFVQFETQEDTEQALGRNRDKIGHRYIEVFRSSVSALKRATSGNGRPGPYDLKDRGGNRNMDFGGRNNMRNNDVWGNGGGFGVGANNSLGFNNMPAFGNNGNGNFGNFGNNGFNGNGFGNGNNGFGNNGFGGNNGNFGNGNNGNFGNDFGDFGNFGNNRNFANDSFGNNRNGNNGGNFNNFGNNGFNTGFNGNNGGGNFGPIGGGRNEVEQFTVHMRGLPYSSFENDIYKFFDPIRPTNVRINFNKKGLHSGTADVFFDSIDDAQLAMKRHREQMGSRYIELFFDGKTKGGNGGNSFSRRI